MTASNIDHTHEYPNDESNDHFHDHRHDHDNEQNHDHSHTYDGNIISKIFQTLFHTHSDTEHEILLPEETTEAGIRAVKLSFLGLMITAILQVVVVFFTQSVALLADTVHNFSDAFSSIPLWIAFALSRRAVQKRKYPYGYGKAEDLAGLFIIFLIAASAVLVFVESFNRLLNPISPKYLGVLTIAAIIGYLGNEFVARYRIRVGEKIQSEALIADGLHSRTDAYVSLSVVVGAIGAYFGFPIIDPIVGLVIGVMILFILRDASKRIWLRLMDGIDPSILTIIEEATKKVENVSKVVDVRARWVGRSLLAEVEIIINRDYTVANAYIIENDIRTNVKSSLPYLSSIIINNIPCDHHKTEGQEVSIGN